MAELLRQYVALLEQVVVNPERRIGEFSLRTTSASACLPDPTATLEPIWHEALTTRFSRHAQATPDAVEGVDDHESWTYAELEARSNQLGHHLRRAGIGAENMVAIYGYRGASHICALLGVLKAGAGFAILDPRYLPAPLMTGCRLPARRVHSARSGRYATGRCAGACRCDGLALSGHTRSTRFSRRRAR